MPNRRRRPRYIWITTVVLLLSGAAFFSLKAISRGAPKIDPTTHVEQYGNLYSDLLDYVIFAVLIFYVLTIAGLFLLRRKQPNAERPYRAFGYPIVPALYILAASAILIVLLLYRTNTSWPGLLIVLTGVPIYFLWKKRQRPAAA